MDNKKFLDIEKYSDGIGTEFNKLMFEVVHENGYRRKGMVLRITPVHMDDGGWSCVFDFQKDPLTAGLDVAFVEMPRKNQKRMDAAFADLCGLAPRICELWNKRDFEGIKSLFA